MAMVLRFLGRLWAALDVVRKFLHLILMLALFAIVWAAFHPASPVLPRHAALLVRPEGRLVEQLSGDAVDRAIGEANGRSSPETLVKDLTDTIRAAGKDPRIGAIVLDASELSGGGLSKLEAVATALREFRATGKKVLAHGAYVTQEQYYLLASADEVWLEPAGAVVIDGYAAYRHYFRDVLDKLGVTVNVFKVGTYKSFVEQYTQAAMSAADREQTDGYLRPLWASYEAAIVKARGLGDGALTAYVGKAVEGLRAAKGDAALFAEQQGLVNGRKTRIEFEARVAELVGIDPDTHGFNAVDVAQYQAVARTHLSDDEGPTGTRVAVLPAVGEIRDGEQPPGTIGGESLARLLHDVRYDKSVRAVVLRIDSPGGSVQASEQIRQEVEALKQAGKPVVSSFASVAASGGYYIAMESDEIYAEPTTITGSIGVFAILPTFERAMGKIGVGSDGVGTSPLAGATDLTRPLTPEVRDVLQQSVEFTYGQFIGRVAKARGKTPEEIDAIAQGRVWIAADALSRGLIDHVGGLKDAIRAAAARAGLKEGQYGVSYREKQLTWREALMRNVRADGARLAASAGLTPRSRPGVERALNALDGMAAAIASFSDPRGVYLYCGCDLR